MWRYCKAFARRVVEVHVCAKIYMTSSAHALVDLAVTAPNVWRKSRTECAFHALSAITAISFLAHAIASAAVPENFFFCQIAFHDELEQRYGFQDSTWKKLGLVGDEIGYSRNHLYKVLNSGDAPSAKLSLALFNWSYGRVDFKRHKPEIRDINCPHPLNCECFCDGGCNSISICNNSCNPVCKCSLNCVCTGKPESEECNG